MVSVQFDRFEDLPGRVRAVGISQGYAGHAADAVFRIEEGLFNQCHRLFEVHVVFPRRGASRPLAEGLQGQPANDQVRVFREWSDVFEGGFRFAVNDLGERFHDQQGIVALETAHRLFRDEAAIQIHGVLTERDDSGRSFFLERLPAFR